MTYVIANPHGSYTQFVRLLEVINFKKDDVMFVLGDIVDYGSEPIDLLCDLSFRENIWAISGEHDRLAFRMLKGFDDMLKNGGTPDAEYISEALQVNALYKAGESRDVCNAKARELGLTSQYHANAIVARTSRPDRDILRLDAVRIGGMAFVTTQYEMFSDHARYIKENSPFEMTMISTSSNGDAIYIPTAEAYDYGCYESYVSYFAKGTGESAADQLIEMLNQLKQEA